MVNKLLFLFLLLVLILCGGCKTKNLPSQPEDPIVAAVNSYITLSGRGDWNNALNLLSGEALIEAKKNLKRNPKVKSAMELKSIILITSNALNNFAIVKADFFKGEENKSIFYHLRKLDGHWLIFKLSYREPNLPPSFALSTISPELKEFLEKRLSEMAAQALPNENRQELFKGFSFSCLGESEGIKLVEITYTVKTAFDKPKDMRVLYTLAEDRATWRVVGTDVIQKI